jgi:hypothetical protein
MKQVLLYEGSGAASFVSVPYDLGDLETYAMQVTFSGGGGNLAGTLTLEASADESPATEFVTVSGSSQAVTSSTNHTWNVQGAGYRYVRVRWVFSSGTGNAKVRICAKETVVKGA